MKNKLIWVWAWRELFHGQLWPILVSLSLIIASVFALAALAGRIESAVTQEGRTMLAADLVLRTDAPLDVMTEQNLLEKNLATAKQTRFRTMAFSDEKMQLVSVKAVDSNYPLRGELILSGKTDQKSQVLPQELWLDKRLLELLNVKIGDEIELGDQRLKVSGTIDADPELSFNPFNQMPTVMIHESDIDAAGVVRPGSRASFRYFFKGNAAALTQLQKDLPANESRRWLDETSNRRTGDILERTKNYLSLTILLVIMMAAATLQLTCRHYVESRLQSLSMVKSLGASQQWIYRWLGLQLSILFISAVILGLVSGAALEFLLRLPLVDILPQPLPDYGVTPWIIAPLVSLLVALPAVGIPLNRLIHTSALSVFQPENQRKSFFCVFNVTLMSIPILALFIWAFHHPLFWIVALALVGMLVLLAGSSMALLALIQVKAARPSIRLALSRMNRTPLLTGIQLGAIATSFMVLLIIWLMQKDLLQDWKQTLPENVPNVFALNIAETELPDYLNRLDQKNLIRSNAYPISRGRLVGKNAERFQDLEPDESNRDNALRRELNFTWQDQLPAQNTIIEGDWSQGGVSVEEGIAGRLDIQLGDTLLFMINGLEFSRTVTSIRKVEWRNMRPNFYFIFEPKTMTDFPANWLVSFRLNDNQEPFLNQLARDYPTVSLLDLRSMGQRVQDILNQIHWSLFLLAGLAVVSGLLLVLTLLRLSLIERQKEITLYRILGASKQRIRATLWIEYGLMAIVAGFIAVVGAEFAMQGLLRWGLELPARFHFEVWLLTPLIALFLVYMTVFVMLKSLLKTTFQA